MFQRLGRGSMTKHTLIDDIISNDRTREIYADEAFNLAGKFITDLPVTPICGLVYDVAHEIREGLLQDVCELGEAGEHWQECLDVVRRYLERRGWLIA